MNADYTPPQFLLDAFNCPHCGAYAHQTWHSIYMTASLENQAIKGKITDLKASRCGKCKILAFWLENNMIHPLSPPVPLPSADMPEDVKVLYGEARNVMSFSPRASAALLRLAVEQLMPHLGAQGNDLNDKIGDLVKKGLDKRIQEALDSLRVIGNNAIHPGQINIEDDPNIAAGALFNLLNIIVDSTITRDNQIRGVHDSLPEGAKAAIKRRDS